MNNFNELRAWGKAHWQKPGTFGGLGVVAGIMIGIGADSIGLGIAFAIALGASGYAASEKN